MIKSLKKWFTVNELAKEWECEAEDVLHLAETQQVRISFNLFLFIKGIDREKFSARFIPPGMPDRRGVSVDIDELHGNPITDSFVPSDGIIPLKIGYLFEIMRNGESAPIGLIDVIRREPYTITTAHLLFEPVSPEVEHTDLPTLSLSDLLITRAERERFEKENGQLEEERVTSEQTELNTAKKALALMAYHMACNAGGKHRLENGRPNISQIVETLLSSFPENPPYGYGKSTITGAIKGALDTYLEDLRAGN